MYRPNELDIADAVTMQRYARADYQRVQSYLALGDIKSAVFWQNEMRRNSHWARLIMEIQPEHEDA